MQTAKFLLNGWLYITGVVLIAYCAVWIASKVHHSIHERKRKETRERLIKNMRWGIMVEFIDTLDYRKIKRGRIVKYDHTQQYAIVRSNSGEMFAPGYDALIRQL